MREKTCSTVKSPILSLLGDEDRVHTLYLSANKTVSVCKAVGALCRRSNVWTVIDARLLQTTTIITRRSSKTASTAFRRQINELFSAVSVFTRFMR